MKQSPMLIRLAPELERGLLDLDELYGETMHDRLDWVVRKFLIDQMEKSQ